MVTIILFGVAFLAAAILLTCGDRDGWRLGKPKKIEGNEGVEPFLISGEGTRASGSGDGPMRGSADERDLKAPASADPAGNVDAIRSRDDAGGGAPAEMRNLETLVGAGGAGQPESPDSAGLAPEQPEPQAAPIMLRGALVDPTELIEFDSDTEALVLTKAVGAPDPTLGMTDNGNGTRTLVADGRVVATIASDTVTEDDIVFIERGGPVGLVT